MGHNYIGFEGEGHLHMHVDKHGDMSTGTFVERSMPIRVYRYRHALRPVYGHVYRRVQKIM